jgi:hypothetical protein
MMNIFSAIDFEALEIELIQDADDHQGDYALGWRNHVVDISDTVFKFEWINQLGVVTLKICKA